MVALVMSSLLAAVTHGTVVVPLLWIIGVVVLIAGVVALVRGGILTGIVLIIIGILLGGLNVF